MPRVKGNVTPLFTLKVGSASAVDFGAELVSVGFEDGDGGQVTFSDFASGQAATKMTATFVLDFAAASAHQYHWTNAGATNVTWALQPATGAVSQTNPKFTGTLTMPRTPLFALEAGDATSTVTFDVEYELDSYTKAIS